MKRLVVIALLMTVYIFNISAQQEIAWMTIKEALIKNQKEPKKIIVDIYTDWCGWCKVMDRSSYSDSIIIEYINANFYPVKFNAEQKEDITLGEQTYKFVANGRRGYHQLAAAMLQGNLGYPSTVFIDESSTVIYMRQGYLKPSLFDTILKFIGDNHYKDKNLDQFSKSYQTKVKDPS